MQGPWNSTGPVGAVGAAPASSSVTLRNSEDLMRSQPSSPSDWRSASAPVTCSSGRVVPLLRSTAQTWNALPWRSEEHTSELQSLMRISYAVFCLKKKNIYEHRPQDNTSEHNTPIHIPYHLISTPENQ